MGRVSCYDVYDTKTKQWLEGRYTAKQIESLVGRRVNAASYAEGGWLLKERYLIRNAKEVKDVVIDAASEQEWQIKFAHEWNKARFRILKACGKVIE